MLSPKPDRPQLTPPSAGVIGLTCALELSKRKENTVTVVAKFMPGDYDIEYTSPFAGANVLPCAPLSLHTHIH